MQDSTEPSQFQNIVFSMWRKQKQYIYNINDCNGFLNNLFWNMMPWLETCSHCIRQAMCHATANELYQRCKNLFLRIRSVHASRGCPKPSQSLARSTCCWWNAVSYNTHQLYQQSIDVFQKADERLYFFTCRPAVYLDCQTTSKRFSHYRWQTLPSIMF